MSEKELSKEEKKEHFETIRDTFNKKCKECYDSAVKEIETVSDDLLENKDAEPHFIYEQLRNTSFRNKYFTDYYKAGPPELVTKEGNLSSWFFECVKYSHNLGTKLITLSDELYVSILKEKGGEI